MEIARQLNISPWDALLAAVKISAAKVQTYEQNLERLVAEHGQDVQKPGELGHHWVQLSMQERRHLARVSKAAIDAGVSERLVRQVELESQVIVRVLARTLDDVMRRLEAGGMSEDAVATLRLEAHGVAHRELLAIGDGNELRELPP